MRSSETKLPRAKLGRCEILDALPKAGAERDPVQAGEGSVLRHFPPIVPCGRW